MTAKKTEAKNPIEEAILYSLNTTVETCSDGMSPANVVDGLFEVARAMRKIGKSITPTDAAPGEDATGGRVGSLTEAVMGVTAGLVAVSRSLSDIADAIRESKTNAG